MLTSWLSPILSWIGVGLEPLLLIAILLAIIFKD